MTFGPLCWTASTTFLKSTLSAHDNQSDVTLKYAQLLWCPESQDFMTHIDHAAVLVDKSLLMTEFFGSWKPLVEVFNEQNILVKSGSSLKQAA